MRNPLTKLAFAEWCEKQSADKGYTYLSTNCAWGQYADALGVNVWERPVQRFGFIANSFAYAEPHTFGALATRLRS